MAIQSAHTHHSASRLNPDVRRRTARPSDRRAARATVLLLLRSQRALAVTLGAVAAVCLTGSALVARWSTSADPDRGRRPRRGPLSRPGQVSGEAGMSTAEYAVGTLAACTFAALLIAIIRSPAIRSTLTGLITSALQLGR